MIGQTSPKVVNKEGYSSWNTPFLIVIKKEGHLSKELWQVFLDKNLHQSSFPPENHQNLSDGKDGEQNQKKYQKCHCQKNYRGCLRLESST